MSSYETYKPSGIDWIGKVPTHWQLKRIKDVSLKILGGGTPDTGIEDYWDWDKETGIPWVAIADITKSAVITDTEKFITQQGLQNSSAQLIDEGKILYSIYASLGKVAISGRKLATNQAILSIYENPNRVNLNFLKYYLINLEDIVAGAGSSTTQNNISLEKLRTFKIAFPEILEQVSIANYLDDQTQKIDRLIANKKAQAEKLKELRQIEINNAVTKGLNPNTEMKDSGIEWLGKIPKHWEVKRLKDLVNRIGDGIHSTPNYVDNSDIYFVNGNNLIQGEIKIFDNTDCIDEDEYSKYKIDFSVGTLLISINGTIGNLAFYKGEKIVLGKSAAYIDFTTKLHNFFLYFYLQSYMVSNIFELSFSGTTIKNLSLFTMRNLRVFLPPLKEQIEIANHLQQRTNAIDKLIRNIEAQIEKMQELRKIKIYEAVTGKIKVNAYAETTA